MLESDAALRLRIQQRIQGWANAGGAGHYRYWALTASADVKDAAVSSPTAGVVQVAVPARQGDGFASTDLLDTVRATVLRDDVRVLTDTVEVLGANIITVPVAAQVWLYPNTPLEVFSGAVATFPAAVEAARGLGWDLTRSWITAALHVAGVHKVEVTAPAADITAGPADCVALGALAISMAGRAR